MSQEHWLQTKQGFDLLMLKMSHWGLNWRIIFVRRSEILENNELHFVSLIAFCHEKSIPALLTADSVAIVAKSHHHSGEHYWKRLGLEKHDETLFLLPYPAVFFFFIWCVFLSQAELLILLYAVKNITSGTPFFLQKFRIHTHVLSLITCTWKQNLVACLHLQRSLFSILYSVHTVD